MSFPPNRRDRDRQIQKLRGAQYQSMLDSIKSTPKFPAWLPGWPEVIEYLDGLQPADPRKDCVLLPAFQQYQIDKDPSWFDVFTAIFWPSIEAVFTRKLGHYDTDPGELWVEVSSAFMQTVARLNVERRQDRIAPRVVNGIFHRLFEQYEPQWRFRRRKWLMKNPPERRANDPAFEEFEIADLKETVCSEVREFSESGDIPRTDALILLGSLIYGTSIKDMARVDGVSYEVMKKRRQRAVATYIAARKKHGKN